MVASRRVKVVSKLTTVDGGACINGDTVKLTCPGVITATAGLPPVGYDELLGEMKETNGGPHKEHPGSVLEH